MPYALGVRIIGGEHGGRRIAAPEGRDTRPMLDRVREAMFGTLAPWLADRALVLDLFAGSGSLGLEALSRGARFVRFVEKNAKAAAVLRANVEALDLGDRAEIVRGDALAPSSWGDEAPDVVIFDPPYPLLKSMESRRAVLTAIERLVADALAPEGVLVFHAPRRAVDLSDEGADWTCRAREYGSNTLWYVQAKTD